MKNDKKISVLLADDDTLILDDISNIIPWETLGFHIVAKAYNGKQAFNYYKEFHPKIVITDIIMPIIDGIELIREIKKYDPASETRFLILSSYDDFSYAKSAIHLGVSDYLLKPELAADSLELIIRKIALEITNTTLSRQDYNSLKLTDFFKHQSLEYSDSYLLDDAIKKERFLFFLCSLSESDGQIYTADRTARFLKAHALTMFKTLDLSFGDRLFRIDSFLVIGISEGKSALSGNIKMWCNSIQAFVRSMNLSCLIMYTPDSVSVTQYKKQYYTYKNQYLYLSLFRESNISLNIRTAVIQEQESFTCIVPDYRDLVLILKKENGRQHLLELADMVNVRQDFAGFRKLFKNICEYFNLNIDNEFREFNSIQAFKNWIIRNYESKSYSESTNIENYSLHVRNAILYMKSHYVDSSLSVESIALNIGLSSGRLSVLFKKELSMTVSEYLTNIRINAAIELLRNSNDKIYEIAEKVGYNSSQYFSRIFFNCTGRKPLDYRNNSFTKYTIGE